MSETMASCGPEASGPDGQVEKIERQLAGIAERMERVEEKLGLKPVEAFQEMARPAVEAAGAGIAKPAVIEPSKLRSTLEIIAEAQQPVERPTAILTDLPRRYEHPLLPPLPPQPAPAILPTPVPEAPVAIRAPEVKVQATLPAASVEMPKNDWTSLTASTPIPAPPVQALAPSPAPPFFTQEAEPAQEDRGGAGFGSDWENLIGGKWALWAGTVSLFLATAFFLAYTWHFLSPWARLGVGFVSGAIFLGSGSFFRQRNLRWFSEGLTGAGLAIFYLAIWTGTQRYGILPPNLAFTAMMLTTAFGVYLAVLYDAVSLNALAVLGGFVTPVIMQGGGVGEVGVSHGVSLLTYVAVLDSGILAVSLFKRWSGITWLSFIGTALLVSAWSLDSYSDSLRWPVFIFITIYALQFLGASCFYSLKNREATAPRDLTLLFATTSLYSMAGYCLTHDGSGHFPGTFPLAVSLFFGVLVFMTKAQAPGNKSLRYSTGGLALFFLTIALPIQLQQEWLGIGWTVEGGMLLLLGYWLRSPLLRRGGQVVWGLSLLSVLNSVLDARPMPHVLFLNGRALPLLICVLISAAVALITRERLDDLEDGRDTKALSPDELELLYAATAVFGGAWLLTQEIYLGFGWAKYPTALSWQAGALFTISCVVSMYAFALFVIGLKARHGLIRLCAVALSALATGLPVWASLAMPQSEWTPFFNLRWFAYLVVTAGLFGTMWLVTRERELIPESEREAFGSVPMIASLFVLIGLSTEVWSGFAHNAVAKSVWQYPALFAIALVWAGYAALLHFLGIQWRQASLRVLSYMTGISAVALLLGHASNALGFAGPSTYAMHPLLNWRFVTFVAVGFLLMIQALMANQMKPGSREVYEEASSAQLSLFGGAVLLWGGTQETLESCHHFYGALGGYWQTISYFLVSIIWMLFASGYFVYGLKRRRDAHIGAACIIGSFGLMFLVATDLAKTRVDWSPILNIRCAAFAVAALAPIVWTWLLEGEREEADENGVAKTAYMRSLIAPFGWMAASIMLWGLTRELYESCFYYRQILGTNWERTAYYGASVLWHGAAAWLLTSGARKHRDDLVNLGTAIALCASFVVIGNALTATRLDWTPVLNARFLSFVAGTAALGLANCQANRRREGNANHGFDSMSLIGLLAASLLLWGVTQEAYETCFHLRGTLGPTWERWAQMSISVVWSVYGALLLIGGINRSSRTTRVAALGLLVATIGKVFLFDLSFLDTGLRILSLGGLGVALIFISWLYSRYGVSRGENGEQFPKPIAH